MFCFSALLIHYKGESGQNTIAIVFISLTGLQFLLAPVLAVFAGGWKNYILQDSPSLDLIILFSGTAVLSTTFGYLSKISSLRRVPSTFSTKKDLIASFKVSRYSSLQNIVCLVTASWICFLGFHLLVFGDLGEIMYSTKARAFGQFSGPSVLRDIGYLLNSLSGALALFSAILIGLYSSRHSQSLFLTLLIAIVLLTLTSVTFFYKFSRVAGICFLIAAVFSSQKVPGKRQTKFLIITLCIISVYLSLIGFTHRFQNGYASFIMSALSPSSELLNDYFLGGNGQWSLLPNIVFLDASSSASAHVSFSSGLERSNNSFFHFLLLLQPLPSTFFDYPVRVGANLTTEFGATGYFGLTTPALAELYHLFGFWSVILFFFYGRLLCRVDRLINSRPSPISFLVFVLIFGGILVSGHSGIRAFARPTVLAVFLLGLYSIKSKPTHFQPKI